MCRDTTDESMTCESCRHWHRLETRHEHGTCQYRAPRPTYQWLDQPEDIAMKSLAVAVWPTTFFDDACSCWVDKRRRSITSKQPKGVCQCTKD